MQHGNRRNLEVTMARSTQRRDPRVKLLLTYDILAESQQSYYEFILREYIPALQTLGLQMTEAWHTAYGDYPLRMAGFVAQDAKTLRSIMESHEWEDLQEKLKQYVVNLDWKVVGYKDGFQF